jgi:hypothetical protein
VSSSAPIVALVWEFSGAARKAASMLVREVSDSAYMVILGRVGYYYCSKRTVKRPHKEIQLINVL